MWSSTSEMSLFNVKSGFLGKIFILCNFKCSMHIFNEHFICIKRFADIISQISLIAEAVVRGFKLGLLSSADYNNLSQCETLDDIKLYLVSPTFVLT